METRFAAIASSSPFLSSLYYMVVNTAFRREQQVILAGRKQFESDKNCPADSSSLLRRNIHRLEKGLISRPRRDVFALQYIRETVSVYEKITKRHKSHGIPEIAWANDVLNQYFRVAESHPLIDELRAKFMALPNIALGSPPDRADCRAPYVRQLGDPAVRYEQMLQLSRQRRSIRWFRQKTVPRELLLKALAVATHSPSACNRQPFQFRIFDEPEIVRQVAQLPAGTVGYEHNFPCVVVVVGRQRYYFDERDRHLIYIDGSLAAMSFVLALETLGLSSCCINWPDIEERERKAAILLKLEPDERPVMFIAVGYPDPDGLVAYSEKRSPEELSRFNFE